ncbi:hypothetical protein [Salimicrobium humidisoli]|uniref:hypothetical protein n=1 Tax=Salimicrobium humidisoli TaxID=2029857 RepID=UPI001304331C|nr:hypothetical protein [Salimicrobium humidisoli]
MTKMTSDRNLTDLTEYLKALAHLHDSGHRCNTEISRALKQIEKEIGIDDDEE